jgi:hypothetical protein
MARKRQKRTECPNCGLVLRADDNYCARCGQENHTHKIPVRHFIVDLLGGLFNFDTKLLRTLRDLFWPPGLATRNYNENKRARYVPPLRFYLFSSLLFFIAAAWLPSGGESVGEKDKNGIQYTAGSDSLDETLTRLAREGKLTDAVIDSAIAAGGEEPNFLTRRLIRTAMEQNAGGEAQRSFLEQMQSNFSTALFALLPLFALLMKMACFRQKRYFTEHLVFALHYHTVFFLLLLMGNLIDALGHLLFAAEAHGQGIMIAAGVAILPWMMRTAYQRPWGRSIVKAFLVLISYLILLGLAVGATAIVTALLR